MSTIIGQSILLTAEDAAIFFHCLGDTARHAMGREFKEDGEITSDQRVIRRLMKRGRDHSAARLHIADRATQGMDEGDATEVAYSYIYGDRS